MLHIGGDNFQFYLNFALFSTLGDEARPRFFFVNKLSEDPPQKRSSTKFEEFSSPSLSEKQKKSPP